MTSLTRLESARQFREARRAEQVLARFESATALVDHLTDDHGDLDEKDDILAVLVRAVQVRCAWAPAANAVLWCGMWPGLDRVYLRCLKYFQFDGAEATEAFSVAFATVVGGLKRERVRRVAATLARSTKREVLEERRRELADLKLRDTWQELVTPLQWELDVALRLDWERVASSTPGLEQTGSTPEVPARSSGDDPQPLGAFVGISTGRSFDSELAVLRARLHPVVGNDTDLVLAVLVLDDDQREAADRLGLTHENARKRFQRALPRVREYFARALSRSIPEMSVDRVRRVRKRGA